MLSFQKRKRLMVLTHAEHFRLSIAKKENILCRKIWPVKSIPPAEVRKTEGVFREG